MKQINDGIRVFYYCQCIQFLLVCLSIVATIIRVICKGWQQLFGSFGKLCYLSSDLVIFCVSGMFISFDKDFYDYSNFEAMMIFFTLETVFICVKQFSLVILFLKYIKIVNAFLKVVNKAFVMCRDLVFMLIIAFIFFSEIGMAFMGGQVTKDTAVNYKKAFGSDLDEGMEYLNFNDYVTSMYAITMIIFQGWNPIDQINFFQDQKYNHLVFEYYLAFVYYFFNVFIVNIVQNFFVDNLMKVMETVLGSGGDKINNVMDSKSSVKAEENCSIIEVEMQSVKADKSSDNIELENQVTVDVDIKAGESEKKN